MAPLSKNKRNESIKGNDRRVPTAMLVGCTRHTKQKAAEKD